jgi:hypothetical protein
VAALLEVDASPVSANGTIFRARVYDARSAQRKHRSDSDDREILESLPARSRDAEERLAEEVARRILTSKWNQVAEELQIRKHLTGEEIRAIATRGATPTSR